MGLTSNEESTYQLEPEVVVYRDLDLLLGAEVAFGGLDGGVAEQELDLFQVSAALSAKLRTCPSQVVRTKTLDADLLGRLFDDRPDGPVAQGLAADFPALANPQECGLRNYLS
jgi:hypothetical protein